MTQAVQQAERLIQGMSRSERAQLREWLSHDDDSGVFAGIEKTPGVCGGNACVAPTRIPVWGLEESRRSGATDAVLLQSYSMLTAEDLANAWAYVRTHQSEIDRAIEGNKDENLDNPAFDGPWQGS